MLDYRWISKVALKIQISPYRRAAAYRSTPHTGNDSNKFNPISFDLSVTWISSSVKSVNNTSWILASSIVTS
ncbi:hypothetical protein L6452_31057 [Arctium lappa]|uniref:Uncharacterized protein n=1 Tax=Arctium lappa TaxID=4217 RepID=A0ACB8ZKC0_ARCLA|nr:hypothetical protein L6452_31057 [Arctium lappa]